MSPFFSIIIVNYNYDKYLEQCICSVINQNETDYELILIDGGSTDKSINIINKYKNYFKYYVSEKDNGQSHAINKGISLAKGEYIFWLNSDDFLIKNSLSFAKKNILNYPEYLWFTSNTIFVSQNNHILKFYRGLSRFSPLKKTEYVNVGGPTSIVNKLIYKEVGFFNEKLKYTMDSDMWIRISKLGYKSIRIKNYMWGFRLHKLSKTTSSHFNNISPEHLNEINLLKNNYDITNNYFFNFYNLFKKISSRNTLFYFFDNYKYRNMKISEFENQFLND
jgi:glycosyltransferase involved in cell wall biosynthesis